MCYSNFVLANSWYFPTERTKMIINNIKSIFGTIPVTEFAESIGKPVSTVYSWRRNGDIPERCFAKVGRCIFVRVEQMSKFLNGELID